jgi:S-methylmethionine-dependent homocysteine/selenocysteine methylase
MFQNSTQAERDAKRDAEYWRDRATELEEQKRKAEEDRQGRFEQRRRESRERAAQAMREADTWAEAFQKQRGLLQKEIDGCLTEKAAAERDEYHGGGEAADPAYWQRHADELQAAVAAVNRAEQLLGEQLRAAREAFEAARDAVLESVAASIEAEFPKDGQCIPDHLRNDDPSGLLNW